MNKSSFEDVLAEKGKLIYTNVGDSMYPLIQPRDLLVIEVPKRPLKRFDVPLYKRESGQYVLHRAVRVGKADFTARGDNRFFSERGIRQTQILGVLTSIIRDGREIPMNSPEAIKYLRKLRIEYPVKYLRYRAKSVLNRFSKRIRRNHNGR